MTDGTMKLMFGNQRQSVKQNEVMADFVEEYLGKVSTVDDIKNELNSLMHAEYCSLGICDIFFVTLFLGSDALDEVGHGPSQVRYTHSETGKVEFYLEDAMPLYSPKYEGRAEDIVRKIINACPPAVRASLPEDDKLAAVILSQSYWLGQI